MAAGFWEKSCWSDYSDWYRVDNGWQNMAVWLAFSETGTDQLLLLIPDARHLYGAGAAPFCPEGNSHGPKHPQALSIVANCRNSVPICVIFGNNHEIILLSGAITLILSMRKKIHER